MPDFSGTMPSVFLTEAYFPKDSEGTMYFQKQH